MQHISIYYMVSIHFPRVHNHFGKEPYMKNINNCVEFIVLLMQISAKLKDEYKNEYEYNIKT